ncbi:spore coat protein GerQ [Anaerobacillus sp. MEB173]|uniref:spore coat protein GerQ n=1 Tax=Anaerobacillus sp. MEB173 TaxID=3383345 RepID=UPI003F8EFF83
MYQWDMNAMQGYGIPQQHWQMGWPQQHAQMGWPQQHWQMPTGMPGTPEPPPPGTGGQFPGFPGQEGMLPLEQSYIENILRLNRGKIGTFHFTFENNNEWNALVIRGVVEEAGRDHIILKDPDSDRDYLMLMVNFDYAVFDEHLEYDYPFNGAAGPTQQQLATYSPR